MRNPGTDFHRRDADEAWANTLIERAPIEAANRKEWERRALAALNGYNRKQGDYAWIMATQGVHKRRVEYRNGRLVLGDYLT